MRSDLRPKVSATLAKKRRKDPVANLKRGQNEFFGENERAYAEEALIHVIWADVMCNERPIGAVMTVQAPYRNEDMPIDMVAVRIKRHSWVVDLKQSGRLPVLEELSSDGARSTGPRLPSTAAILNRFPDERWRIVKIV
jgi:hypothetical protein